MARATTQPQAEPAKERFRWLPIVGPACFVIAATAALFATHSSATARSSPRCPPIEEAATIWSRVVEDVGDTVPPRLLLGAPGSTPALDRVLGARGLTRDEFQRTAATVIGAVGAFTNQAAREAFAATFAEFPLPYGIEVPEAAFPDRVVRSRPLEVARALVLGLIARLEGS